MKKTLLGLLIGLGLLSAGAHAQNIPAPGGSTLTAPARFSTYSTTYVAITTAASLTDFLTITGSATKTIYLRNIECSGVSTAAGLGTLALVKRSTADSSGTALTPSATVGGQLVPVDSADGAASATVVAYSANPTTGTLVGLVRSAKLNTGVTGTGTAPLLSWNFGGENAKSPTLRGTAQVLALTGLGTAMPAGAVLTCGITWIEQ